MKKKKNQNRHEVVIKLFRLVYGAKAKWSDFYNLPLSQQAGWYDIAAKWMSRNSALRRSERKFLERIAWYENHIEKNYPPKPTQ